MSSNLIDFSDSTGLYTLQLPSRLDSITTVENFIDTLRDKYDLNEETYANVLICLSEAVINAIVHGNKEQEDKMVYLNLEVVSGKRLIFTIADEGDGFDYNNLPDPTAPENLENFSGRGVFIIKKLADQCIFNTKGNELELHFKI
ncbi:ATP-binding protein [Daejeonella oryzae]|uniref:ATP-binding protein n=1 Tax=Daejeonella oryzae TaxID=1122943 RepID=UPI000409070A|nr:ATP-binding protein [Daejeonella oryzae]